MDDPQHATIQVLASLILFYLLKFLFNLKLCMMVDVCVLYLYIFLDIFFMYKFEYN